MKIDFGKIVTNALSTLVAAVFVGACVIVWREATTVQDKIDNAMDAILLQSEYTQQAVEVLQSEMFDFKKTQNILLKRIVETEPLKHYKKSDESPPVDLLALPMIPTLEPKKDFIQRRLPNINIMQQLEKKR